MNGIPALIAIPEWLFFTVGGIVAFAVVLAINAARARKRGLALAGVAAQMGFQFEGKASSNPEQGNDLRTALFRKGNGRRFQNIMSEIATIGEQASIFDYSFVTGEGTSSHTTAQTVATFAKSGARLPEFQLTAAGLVQKIGDVLAHRNIQFESHPEFSRQFRLRSPDEGRTRALFTPELLSYFEKLELAKNWTVEGAGKTIIVYRSGKRMNPGDLQPFFKEAASLAAAFFALASPSTAGNNLVEASVPIQPGR